MSIVIRRLTEADLAAVDELRRLAGWNQTLEDWARLLSLEPEGCFLASNGGQVVGTVTITCYGRALAWIGMMLVHPDRRRQGVGTRLMTTALDYLSGRKVVTVRLDATPAGRPLYERLGFVAEWTLTRWQRPALDSTPPRQPGLAQVRELLESDWLAIVDLDAAIFGAPRERLLRSLAQVAGGAIARVWPAQGAVRGWGLLRSGANAKYLGPLICARDGPRPFRPQSAPSGADGSSGQLGSGDSHPEGWRLLLSALLVTAPSSAVTWDIPDQNHCAQAAARDLAFMPTRPLTRMRLGPVPIACPSPSLFAIADPALG
jgi:predicted N-acetyltransferase YhbS